MAAPARKYKQSSRKDIATKGKFFHINIALSIPSGGWTAKELTENLIDCVTDDYNNPIREWSFETNEISQDDFEGLQASFHKS